MPRFVDVLREWEDDKGVNIHPTRKHESEAAYWASGIPQAADAARHIPEGGTVIDFGAGDGRVSIPLAKLGFDVLAVEASPSSLARLRANTKKAGVTVRTLKSDGLNLDTRVKEPVDAVVCRAVLIHHCHADVQRLVTQMAAVIRRGGFLIADWPTGVHHERIDWIDVTTWEPAHRLEVGRSAGLELLEDTKPSVWVKQ